MVLKLFFGQIFWNSNDWIVRNWQVSAKALSVSIFWVTPQVHFIRKHFVWKQTMCYCKSVNTHLTVCFAFLKLRRLLHSTADRAETVFGHLNKARDWHQATIIFDKHSGHVRTRRKCRKHRPKASVFYIFWVFSNAQSVLSPCNTWLIGFFIWFMI